MNLQRLIDDFGHLVVPIRRFSGIEYTKETSRLDDYLNYLLSLNPDDSKSENLYLAEWKFEHSSSDLKNIFLVPQHFSYDLIEQIPINLRFSRRWIFIGHPGVFTPAHTDSFSLSAWLTMVWGSKTIRLISPKNVELLGRISDLFSSDVTEFDKSLIYEATLNPGDTLYIPGRWFHHVRNIDKNFMITGNVLDPANVKYFLGEFCDKLFSPIEALSNSLAKFMPPLRDSMNEDTFQTLELDRLQRFKAHVAFRLMNI